MGLLAGSGGYFVHAGKPRNAILLQRGQGFIVHASTCDTYIVLFRGRSCDLRTQMPKIPKRYKYLSALYAVPCPAGSL
jgi:hypothetical protein